MNGELITVTRWVWGANFRVVSVIQLSQEEKFKLDYHYLIRPAIRSLIVVQWLRLANEWSQIILLKLTWNQRLLEADITF